MGLNLNRQPNRRAALKGIAIGIAAFFTGSIIHVADAASPVDALQPVVLPDSPPVGYRTEILSSAGWKIQLRANEVIDLSGLPVTAGLSWSQPYDMRNLAGKPISFSRDWQSVVSGQVPDSTFALDSTGELFWNLNNIRAWRQEGNFQRNTLNRFTSMAYGGGKKPGSNSNDGQAFAAEMSSGAPGLVMQGRVDSTDFRMGPHSPDGSWESVACDGEGRNVASVEAWPQSLHSRVMVSHNWGNSWKSVFHFPDVKLRGVAVSGNGKYMAIVGDGSYILTSQNFGNNWHLALPDVRKFWTGVASSRNGEYWLAGGEDGYRKGALYIGRRDDHAPNGAGISWSSVSANIAHLGTWSAFSVSRDGRVMLAGMITRDGTKKVFFSRDFGNTWVDANAPAVDTGWWNSVTVTDEGKQFFAAVGTPRVPRMKDYVGVGSGSIWDAGFLDNLTGGPNDKLVLEYQGNHVWKAASSSIGSFKYY